MLRRLAFVLIALLISSTSFTQTGTVPETGYISDFRYVNPFFGFVLPLPQGAEFHDLILPSRANSHFLFGLQAQQKSGLTALTVNASQEKGDVQDKARKTAAGPKGLAIKRIEIGGRQFWKAESEEKSRVGKMRTVTYTGATDDYVLQFTLVSFDVKLADALQRDIESISFVGTAEAKAVAGSNARLFPATPGGASTSRVIPTHIAQLSPGVMSGNTYRNETLGFSFQFPERWVLADKGTQESVMKSGHQLAWGNDSAAAGEHSVAEQCSKILLWATKYPEGTKTDEINPLIAIVAFDSDCMQGVAFPTSLNDTEAIRRVGTQISSTLSGTPFIGKGQNSLRAFALQNRLMVDLSSAFKVEVPNRREPWDVVTSIILTEDNSYWVACMFMDGSQSGLDHLRSDIKILFASSDIHAEQKHDQLDSHAATER